MDKRKVRLERMTCSLVIGDLSLLVVVSGGGRRATDVRGSGRHAASGLSDAVLSSDELEGLSVEEDNGLVSTERSVERRERMSVP